MTVPLPPEARSSPSAGEAWESGGGGDSVWFRRAVALIVDNILLAIPLVVATVLLVGTEETETTGGEELSGAELLLVVLWFGLPFLYFTFFHGGESGQTLGKRMMGIAVRDAKSRGRLGYGKAFLRYLAVFFLGLFLIPIILSYLWPLFDGLNQSLHDKMISTIVVRA